MQNKYILLMLVHIIPSTAMDNNHNNTERPMFPKWWYKHELLKMVEFCKKKCTNDNFCKKSCMKDYSEQYENFMYRKAVSLCSNDPTIDPQCFVYVPENDKGIIFRMLINTLDPIKKMKDPNIARCVDHKLKREEDVLNELVDEHRKARKEILDKIAKKETINKNNK